MNSKGFRMRRDHEAQQELGLPDERFKSSATPPEQRLADQRSSPTGKARSDEPRPSILTRIWRSITS